MIKKRESRMHKFSELICKLFGHNYYQGKITLALDLKPSNGRWEKITHSSETVICRRCEFVPVISGFTVGAEDANISFTQEFSIGNMRLFTKDESVPPKGLFR